MRSLNKVAIPAILQQNHQQWTAEHLADPQNKTKKYRYRHPDIKKSLKEETADKCVYCESKIGHNTPGDVEHKIPSSVDRSKHFAWTNLTIACTECNRRKNAYFDAQKPFLDPYTDDVETLVLHLGPIATWKPGEAAAEITIRTLELDNSERKQLISMKIEKIAALNNLVERIGSSNPLMKAVLALQLENMKGPDAEYSAMINSICSLYGIQNA